MWCMFLTLPAEFLQLKSILEYFFVLVGMIIHLFTFGAFQFDQVILRHLVFLVNYRRTPKMRQYFWGKGHTP